MKTAAIFIVLAVLAAGAYSGGQLANVLQQLTTQLGAG